MIDVNLPRLRERLQRSWRVPLFEQLAERVRAFSQGDRVLFYALAALASTVALSGLYALQQSLLVEVPAYGGSLHEGAVGSPQFINPLLAISDADHDLATLTYAGLMGLSGDGTLVPVLAESYTLSPDGKVYVFNLRDDISFTDGTPVTAQDGSILIGSRSSRTAKFHSHPASNPRLGP